MDSSFKVLRPSVYTTGAIKKMKLSVECQVLLGWVVPKKLSNPTRTGADWERKIPAPEASMTSFHVGFTSGAVSV